MAVERDTSRAAVRRLGASWALLLVVWALALPASALASNAAPTIDTVAGGNPAGVTPASTPATSLGMAPIGVTAASGGVYVNDHNESGVELLNNGAQQLVAGDNSPAYGVPQSFPYRGLTADTTILDEPSGSAVDPAGNVLVADTGLSSIELVARSTGSDFGRSVISGDVYTLAGGADADQPGYGGDGGPASAAQLNRPQDVAVDAHGNLVIADTGNERIRVVAATSGTFYGVAMTAGDIYTVAGDGSVGFSGDGGRATSAGMRLEVAAGGELGANVFAGSIAVDQSGNIVVADTGDNRVRVVAAVSGTFYGVAMTAGDIYTVAGTGAAGFGGDAGPATAATLEWPTGVAIDAHRNIVVADTFNDRIRVVAGASGTYYGAAMTAGDVYTIAGTGARGYAGDGGSARSAELNTPEGISIDSSGNVVIADTFNWRVRVVAAATGTFDGVAMTTGDVYTIAGDGSESGSVSGLSAAASKLGQVAKVATGRNGDVYLSQIYEQDGTAGALDAFVAADSGYNVVVVRMIPATSETRFGITMTAGDVYTVAGNSAGITGYGGDGGPGTSASLAAAGDQATAGDGIAVDASGNVIIDDAANARVRVVAATSGTFYGVKMTAGDIYTVAGDGTPGYAGDGGPAPSAEICGNFGDGSFVATDPEGNIIISDGCNMAVRVVAESTGTYYGVAMTAGDIYTVAGDGTAGANGSIVGLGGPATSAQLPGVTGMAADAQGNLVVDTTQAVTVVAGSTGTFYGIQMTFGHLYAIGGSTTGVGGCSGDGAPATSADTETYGVTTDAAGNVLVASAACLSVQVIANSTATMYGQAMTAGDMYTLAGIFHTAPTLSQGGGAPDETGDGGPASTANLLFPLSVALTPNGQTYVASGFSYRLRKVSFTSYPLQATVSGLSPSNGPVAGGTTVTISGGGFSGASAVDFGGTVESSCATSSQPCFTVNSDSSITATSPPGGGPNSAVNVQVVDAGLASAAEPGDQFVYAPSAPVVTSVSPVAGPLGGGTEATVTGSGFSDASTVDFGSVAESNCSTSAQPCFTVNSDSSITATSPPGSDTTNYVDVQVVRFGQPSAVTPQDQFIYGPVITGVSPASGPATGGNTVTVTGTGFLSDGGISFLTVQVEARTAQVTPSNVTDTSFTFVAPANPGLKSGNAIIVLEAYGPASQANNAVTEGQYLYNAPVVSSVSPDSGPVAGQTPVTIAGSGFTNASTVDFGSVAESNCSTSAQPCFTVNSDSSITATSPPGSDTTDDVNVRVIGPDRQQSAVSSNDQFVYGPVITGVSPASGPATGGNTVTVTGTGFLSDGGISLLTVQVGARAAQVTPSNVTDTSFTFVAPANPGLKSGNAIIVLEAYGPASQANNAVTEGQYLYNAPVVSSVSPDSGPVAGQTPVTIAGSGFTNASTVAFGSTREGSCSTSAQPCFTVNSDSSITATSPPGTDATGFVNVQVIGPDLQASAVSSNDQFVYGPSIVSFTPTSGPHTGGTQVTITGTGFTSDGGVSGVLFAGSSGGCYATDVTVVSDTQLTLTTPACAKGTKAILAYTAGVAGQVPTIGAEATSLFSFT